MVPNSTYSHKSYFLKYICNFLDQLLPPFKFHGRDMSGILFFIFASCESLIYSSRQVLISSKQNYFRHSECVTGQGVYHLEHRNIVQTSLCRYYNNDISFCFKTLCLQNIYLQVILPTYQITL